MDPSIFNWKKVKTFCFPGFVISLHFILCYLPYMILHVNMQYQIRCYLGSVENVFLLFYTQCWFLFTSFFSYLFLSNQVSDCLRVHVIKYLLLTFITMKFQNIFIIIIIIIWVEGPIDLSSAVETSSCWPRK